MTILEKDLLKLGNFSKAGRDSQETFNILREAMRSKTRTKKLFGIYGPDDDWLKKNKNDKVEDEDIINEYKLDVKNIKQNIDKNLKNTINKNLHNNSYDYDNSQKDEETENDNSIKNKYKYHNKHMEKLLKYKKEGLFAKMNIEQEPIYTPKLELLYTKIQSGPTWDKISSRSENLFNIENYNVNLFYENKTTKNKYPIKGFYDMTKQTQRSNVPLVGDIRLKYEKKFQPVLKMNKIKKNTISNFNYRSITPSFKFETNPPDKKIISFYNDDKKNDKTENNFYKTMQKNNSAPDFNSYLGRDQLNQSKKPARIINGELNPNYNSIESAVKTLVIYRKNNWRQKNYKKKGIRGMSSDEIFNASETFEKIYGNKLRAVPLFQKMYHRPDNNLPLFFNGINNRLMFNTMTTKALMMNNFSGGKLYNLCNNIKKKNKKNKKSKFQIMRESLLAEGKNTWDKVQIEFESKCKKFDDLIKKNNLNIK